MGLFNTIEVISSIELPSFIPEAYRCYFNASFERNGFQTKDLEVGMLHYLVTSDGNMYEFQNRIR